MARKEINYDGNRFEIAYDIINPTQKQDFIVLHGWGSNKEIMKQAFSGYLPQYRHIYIDLPGFGKSSNDIILTTDSYARIMQVFLDTIHARTDIIAGHSFGGKVALLLAPDTLVLLSSAGIPVPKPWQVRLKIALFKHLKGLGLGGLRRYFASPDASDLPQHMYETFKHVVDEDFSDIFAAYRGKALLFWGKEDSATPLFTGEKIAALITQSALYPMEGDHYFFLHHGAKIAEIITRETDGTV